MKIDIAKDIVLIIPDPHIPYDHPDAIPFLQAVQEVWGTTKTVCLGDTADQYGFSRYEKDPDYEGILSETSRMKIRFKEWEEAFPKIISLWGNHDLRLAKRLNVDIPDSLLDMEDILKKACGYPKKWIYMDDLKLPAPGGWAPISLEHGHMIKGAPASANQQSYSVIHGHHHKSFFVVFHKDKKQLQFHMALGCLADPNSIAMRYAQNGQTHKKIHVGCGVLYKGMPIPIPMVLNSKGRWNGQV